jgi:hypothetical protein
MIHSVTPVSTPNSQASDQSQGSKGLIESLPGLMQPLAEQTQSPLGSQRYGKLPASIQALAAMRQSIHRASLKIQAEHVGQSSQSHLVTSRSLNSSRSSSLDL